MESSGNDTVALYKSIAGLFMPDCQKKIIICPRDLVLCEDAGKTGQSKNGRVSELSMLKFPHPATDAETYFTFDEKNGRVFHLMHLDCKLNSWFVGNYVIEDAGPYVLTPIDPLFVILPAFLKAKVKKSFQTAEQILISHYGARSVCKSALELLLKSPSFSADLDLVCKCKEIDGMKYWKLCNRLFESWIRAKISQLSVILEEERINVTSKSCVAGFARSKKDTDVSKEAFEKYAFGMICEFLPATVRDSLAKALGMEEVKQPASTGNSDPPSKKRKAEPDEIEEDYSKNYKPASKPAEKKLTSAQKKLQKVDKTGMKNIASYFARNNTAGK